MNSKERIESLKQNLTKVNVARSSMPSYEEYCEEIKDLWDSHWITNNGIKHETLANLLSEYLECENIQLFTNGHLALENIISAYAFKKGSEVITTPFTFASTTHAIVRNGLVPVFCDIDKTTFTIDASKIEELITEKTVAILPVHVYGNICDVEKIEAIAKKHNLVVIYDAAHAFGEKYKGNSIANYGDASMFSFHATKVFNTIEGGAVCYKKDDIGTRIYELKNFGIHGPESVKFVGGNAKMNEFQAAMGICNLRHIDEEIKKREAVYNRYNSHLKDVPGISINNIQKDVSYNYAYYPVIFDGYKYNRDEVYDRLFKNDIIARKYFYPLTNDFECYKDYPTADSNKTPIAKHIANNVLTLPMYADIDFEIIDKICKIILGD